jgi:hypothetical protein
MHSGRRQILQRLIPCPQIILDVVTLGEIGGLPKSTRHYAVLYFKGIGKLSSCRREVMG